MWYFSTKHFETPVATDTMKSGVLWSEAHNTQQLIVEHCQHPNLFSIPHTESSCLKRSQRLMGGFDRLRKKLRQVYCPWSASHVNKSTYSLPCVRINYKSEKMKVAGEYLVEGHNWCKGRRATLSQNWVLSEHKGGTEILYLTPHMLQPIWKTVPINWLHCGMKPLFEAIKVCTGQRCAKLWSSSDMSFTWHWNKSAAQPGC